jgi:hypothetical protein
MFANINLNKEFRIVFQPYERDIYGKRRFGVGAYSLQKYIGEINANNALQRALDMRTDKVRVRLRKHGIIDIYVK